MSAPATFDGVAGALAAASADGAAIRIAGSGTKPWTAAPQAARVVSTAGLDRILAHDPGDMTATLEAGVPLADAQAAFAEAGQMLALDPPLDGGGPGSATIGGVVATADSGPLAHRYGTPRDLVIGATFALSDGTVASSGGTVIKNVAGYDVAKLLCGSHGTLGAILSVNVRLHPLHPAATAVGHAGEIARLASAAGSLAAAPYELEALDVRWSDGGGAVLARVAGPHASERIGRVAGAMRSAGLGDVSTDGDPDAPWLRQRSGQRSADAAVLEIAARPSQLRDVLRAVDAVGGRVVARAALGRAWATVAVERVAELRTGLPTGTASVLRDCPAGRRDEVADPWGTTPAPALALMRAVKARFDPTGTCAPGTFAGGI